MVILTKVTLDEELTMEQPKLWLVPVGYSFNTVSFVFGERVGPRRSIGKDCGQGSNESTMADAKRTFKLVILGTVSLIDYQVAQLMTNETICAQEQILVDVTMVQV